MRQKANNKNIIVFFFNNKVILNAYCGWQVIKNCTISVNVFRIFTKNYYFKMYFEDLKAIRCETLYVIVADL